MEASCSIGLLSSSSIAWSSQFSTDGSMLSSPIPRDCISNRRPFSARSVVGSSPPAQAKLSRATRIGKIRPWRKASSNERRSRSIHAIAVSLPGG